MERLIIKGKDNSDHLAKQYCFIARDKHKRGYETALVIKRLILIDMSECLEYMQTGHFVIKKFRNKLLCMKLFSVKLSTLKQINNWLHNIKTAK